jgi:hypothetical protein
MTNKQRYTLSRVQRRRNVRLKTYLSIIGQRGGQAKGECKARNPEHYKHAQALSVAAKRRKQTNTEKGE